MYKKRDPQTSLLATSHFLPDEKRRRLEKDWPGEFRRSALPLIDEEAFRELYHEWNGRPNKPVQTVIGVLLLKEMNDLTDAEALFNLDFNLAWHVALDLEPSEAHTCQKTLHNFRAKLMRSEKGGLLFEDTTARIIGALGVSTERQRLDSTHIISNVAVLTRLGLFCETARKFLKELKKKSKKKFDGVPDGLRRRYLKDDGERSSYDDARSSEGRRRLSVCARDVWRLVGRFRGDEAVTGLASYALLARLLEEQCEVVNGPRAAAEGDADAEDVPAPVVVKEAKKVRSDSLQTPHDPSLTYSGKKGKGQEVQIAETCGNEDKPEMITYAEVTRSCDSDESATVPVVDELARREIGPKEFLADTNYGSTENVIECGKRGTELVAPVPGPKVEEAPVEKGKGAVTKADFDIDPKGERVARCPAGCEAVSEERDPETGKVRAVFDGEGCEACPHRDSCPAKPLRDGRRVLRTTVHAAVLAKRRRYERTKEFKKRYAMRAGIEATNSELKRAHGLGRLRIRGVLRVRLAVYLKALACNVKRMVKHLADRARKAENAAAAAAEGAEAAAPPASCVILHLLGLRRPALAAPRARGRRLRAGWRPPPRLAAA
ncbi:MAG: transposase [Alphaproteobacteria bacterium]